MPSSEVQKIYNKLFNFILNMSVYWLDGYSSDLIKNCQYNSVQRVCHEKQKEQVCININVDKCKN